MVTHTEDVHVSDSGSSKTSEKAISRFRVILPQVIASTIVTCLLLDIGFSVSFPGIAISALTGLNVENNANETLHLTAAQASWLGSTSYLAKLFGSISSGWISEPIGRKKAMILVNIPELIAWFLFYNSTTLNKVFIANILLGFGSGFMKAPALNYVGEISEASIRGILVATVSISTMLGLLMGFLLGAITRFRNVALICFIIRIVVIVAVLFVPETPSWLVTKNREKSALKSLQWLRGWVSEDAVQSEFEQIKRHKKYTNSCLKCEKANIECTHPMPTMSQKVKQLKRKRTLKPFFVIIICSVAGFFSGTHHLMPYIVQILNAYQSPLSPNHSSVIVGFTGVCATIACILTVKFVGKRRIYLISLAAVVCVNLMLGIYGFYNLPSNSKSFQHKHLSTNTKTTSILPLILFIVLQFFTTGIILIPFMLLSELFPVKSRSLATGITTAICNISVFIAIKSFYDLENWLNLPSAMCFYAGCGFIGLIVTYNTLPETEGRTLEDIEVHFSDNQKKFTDRNIMKNVAKEIDISDDENQTTHC